MSVVVEMPNGQYRLLTKGAPEEVFQRCTHFELEEDILPMDPVLIQDLRDEYQRLSADGFRVLAVAYKDLERLLHIQKMMRRTSYYEVMLHS